MSRLVLFAALALAAAAPTPGLAPAEERVLPRRVLFVGNSLTRANDLPAAVRALFAAGGDRVEVAAVVRDGFSLADHRAEGTAARLLAGSRWDLVVLQQGPSALPESRVELVAEARRWGEAIRAAGARPALYMVWPARDRAFDLPRVVESYRLAAAASGALLLPAGEAWRRAMREPRAPALWGPDGLHPTAAGTYLAALAIYGAISGRDLATAPANLELPGAPLRLAERTARRLRAAAAQALAGETAP